MLIPLNLISVSRNSKSVTPVPKTNFRIQLFVFFIILLINFVILNTAISQIPKSKKNPALSEISTHSEKEIQPAFPDLTKASDICVWAGTSNAGVWLYENGEWIQRSEGIGNIKVSSIQVNPGDHDVLLAVTSKGVYRSEDRGISWSQVTMPYTQEGWIKAFWDRAYYDDVVISGPDLGSVFNTDPRAAVSHDGGLTWTGIDLLTDKIAEARPGDLWGYGGHWYMVSNSIHNIVFRYGCHMRGIWHSQDRGNTWGLICTWPRKIEVERYITGLWSNPQHIFGSRYTSLGYPVIESTNGGVTWSSSVQSVGYQRQLLADPVRQDVVWLIAQNGLYSFTTGVQNFQLKHSKGEIRAAAVDGYNGTIYSGGLSRVMAYSVDDGTTWINADMPYRGPLNNKTGIIALAAAQPPLSTNNVSIGSDDAGENGACDFSVAHNEIWFGECNTGERISSGFRFTNIPISSPLEVKQAYLEFTVDGPYSNEVEVKFLGEASANSETFSETNQPSDRPVSLLTAVNWKLEATDTWNVGEKKASPDLTNIVREIVSLPDWQAGNALSIMVHKVSSNGNHRRVFAYERNGQMDAAKLIIKKFPKPNEGGFATVEGTILEEGTNLPIEGAKITVVPFVSGGNAVSDRDGYWTMHIPGGWGYELKIVAEGYTEIEETHTFPGNRVTTLSHFMTPAEMDYQEYRIVEIALAPNPPVLEIPEKSIGYAWFSVEGLDKYGLWRPVRNAKIEAMDEQGNIIETRSGWLFYTIMKNPFYLQYRGRFQIPINADIIGDGTMGSQEQITVFKVNDQVLPDGNQAKIKVRIIDYTYTASLGYRVYRTGGLGGTLGIVTGTGFLGGGSGATIEVDLNGFNEEPAWSSFKLTRRLDFLDGVNAGIRTAKIISFHVQAGPDLEFGRSASFEEEFTFNLTNMTGLDALGAFYLFFEPLILYSSSFNSNKVNQMTIQMLNMILKWLLIQSAENRLAMALTANEAGVEGKIAGSVGVTIGFDKEFPVDLELGPNLASDVCAGFSYRWTKNNSSRVQLYRQTTLSTTLSRVMLSNFLPFNNPAIQYFIWLYWPDACLFGFNLQANWQNSQWEDAKIATTVGRMFSNSILPDKVDLITYYLQINDETLKNKWINCTELPEKMLNIGRGAVQIALDNTDFSEDLARFLDLVYQEQDNNLPVQLGYGIDSEKRTEMDVGFAVELPLGGLILSGGTGVEGVISRKYANLKGNFLNGLPYLQYEVPNLPNPRLPKLSNIIGRLWEKVTSANFYQDLLAFFLEQLKITDLLATPGQTMSAATGQIIQLNDRGSTLALKNGAIPSELNSANCVYYEWGANSSSLSLSDDKRRKIQEYDQQLQAIRQQIAGLRYGVGGFFQFEPIGAQFQDSTLLTIVYSDSEIIGFDENELAIFWEDSLARWHYLPSINHPDSNRVSAWIPGFRTYTLAPRLPQGSFGLLSDPDSLAADGHSTATIRSTWLYNNDSTLVADGKLFTVTASRGEIRALDVDENLPGIQIASNAAQIQFTYQSDDISQPVEISAFSVDGFAHGTMQLYLTDVARPGAPRLLSVEPSKDGITLKWQSAEDTDLAGYRIWFDTDQSGAPYNGTASVFGTNSPVNLGLVEEYTLTGLAIDSTYYIAITALDVSNRESDYSNELILTTEIQKPEIIHLPKTFDLKQNFPNPFNPITVIEYDIPKITAAKITIFNALGQVIIDLVNATHEPGTYQIHWDGRGKNGNVVSSGLYFYRIEAGKFIKVKKMILVK